MTGSSKDVKLTKESIALFICFIVGLTGIRPLSAKPASIPDQRLSIGAEESLFWDGPSSISSPDTWTYKLDVVERAFRLRVGIDHPEVGDVFTVTLTPPSGRPRSPFSPGSGLYSAEQAIRNPETGTWTIEIRAEDVSNSTFRMRAKLEAEPPSLSLSKGSVLPNLQVLPPHLPSFLMPVTNGSSDEDPAGVDAAGKEACHPEEHVEDQAVRCLRFAFGVRNTGSGPLHLAVGDGLAYQDRELFQRIERSDGTHWERSAGQARYHKTHGHYHHDAAIGLRLFQVNAPRPEGLVPAGPMRTKGFAHREELLRDWERFYPIWEPVPFGLRAGWADIYEWDRPGNYIDFGLNPDGQYVIRMWADPVKQILESNEDDNVAYAYLEVKGSSVELLEVGRGHDPWDRCKIVVGPGGHPDPSEQDRTRRRPGSCSPDTT